MSRRLSARSLSTGRRGHVCHDFGRHSLWRSARPHVLAVTTIVSLSTLACAPDTAPLGQAGVVGELRSMVSGGAASNLMSPDRFIPSGPVSADEMGETDARSLAQMYVKSFGRILLPGIVEASGLQIQFEDLTVCGQPAIARPRDQRAAADEGERRRNGPHWLVAVCQRDGLQVLAISFSALAGDVANRRPHDGILNPAGADLLALLVYPREREVGVPMTAEAAVRESYRATGIRVSVAPELEQPARPVAPQMSRWRLGLESTARLPIGEGQGTIATRELLVGAHRALEDPRIMVPDQNPTNASVALKQEPNTVSREGNGQLIRYLAVGAPLKGRVRK